MFDEIRPTWLVELHGCGGVNAYRAFMEHGYTVDASLPGGHRTPGWHRAAEISKVTGPE